MWKRKDGTRADPPSGGPLGIGVQVYVRESEPPSGDDWVGEPTGVIIAPGDRSLRNVYGTPLDGRMTWTVSFSEPQRRRDGRGPYETATIPAALLVAAEPITE
jgi:hypothetical protein